MENNGCVQWRLLLALQAFDFSVEIAFEKMILHNAAMSF
jgi:hypothetical protein